MHRRGLYFAWLGASLATMFFYPLLSAISDGLFYLQWQRANTLELLLAFLVIASTMGMLLFVAQLVKVWYVRIILLLLVCAIPFASFAIQVLQQVLGKQRLLPLAEVLDKNLPTVYPLVVVALLTCLYATRRWHEVVQSCLVTLVLILSPLTVFAGITVLRHGFKNPVIEVNKYNPSKRMTQIRSSKPDIFIVLFDELDYDYLYGDEAIRQEYPNIRMLASKSENYHGALSPGEETLTAMVGLMVGQENIRVSPKEDGELVVEKELDNGDLRVVNIAEENIFSIARRKGFQTVLFGWMHPYCMMMYESLDNCRSFSIYNYSTINEPVSIKNPIFTNIILWPRHGPFGLLKKPIYSMYQDKVVSQTYDLAISTLTTNDPIFQFVHFSIPHLPFVYDGDKFRPAKDPFLQNDENYIRQLKYVDHIFGRWVSELKRHEKFDNSYIILLSDHGYRIMRKNDARRIPLIVKRPGQKYPENMYGITRAEVLLRTIVDKV